ncbi:MAG: cell division protein FtsQ/DivIB [Rhodoferax sp.]|nr:cell division protein FtsQ/DivIB [Rhodoferax sp.]
MNEAQAIPLDIRLMNMTASALFVVFVLALLGMALALTLRHPFFAIRGITVLGDVAHTNAVTLRANVAPRLSGTFFTLDLALARAAFEAVPWVRRAMVRREFPNRLRVELQEHQPVAYWGAEGDSTLLNSFGEVFEANIGDVEQDVLPRLSGPSGQGAAVLAMYQTLQPLFEAADLPLEQLDLSGQGSWRAQLDTGAVLELGRGSAAEVQARVQRLLKTVTQVAGRYGRTPQAVETADLRHADGYALRLRGVTTQATEPRKK